MSKKCAVILLIVSIIDLGIILGKTLRDIKEKAEPRNQDEDYLDDYARSNMKEDEHVR